MDEEALLKTIRRAIRAWSRRCRRHRCGGRSTRCRFHGEPGCGRCRSIARNLDTQQFLNGLDAIFDRHTAATEAGPYLEQAMVDVENAGDEAGLLTVLNETMGFYRSQGRHKENQWIAWASAGTGRSYGLDHRHIRGVGHHANQLRHRDARGPTIRSGRGFVSSGAECLPAFAGTHRP